MSETIEEIKEHLEENGFVRLDQCRRLIKRVEELEKGIRKHKIENSYFDDEEDALFFDIDKRLYKLIEEGRE